MRHDIVINDTFIQIGDSVIITYDEYIYKGEISYISDSQIKFKNGHGYTNWFSYRTISDNDTVKHVTSSHIKIRVENSYEVDII